MENFETQEHNPDLQRIFDLEKEIDMRKAFIEQNTSTTSEDIRNKLLQFRKEITNLAFEKRDLERKWEQQGFPGRS